MDSSRAESFCECELDWASMGLEAPKSEVKKPSFSADRTELELKALEPKAGSLFSVDKFMAL